MRGTTRRWHDWRQRWRSRYESGRIDQYMTGFFISADICSHGRGIHLMMLILTGAWLNAGLTSFERDWIHMKHAEVSRHVASYLDCISTLLLCQWLCQSHLKGSNRPWARLRRRHLPIFGTPIDDAMIHSLIRTRRKRSIRKRFLLIHREVDCKKETKNND